ncbi:hypothetical protein A0H81_14907 [Grifola frondosa]|uniref:Uncharacterized protein n=1 Tax=Grifola frondosa TaxID=5627 RepID=A0A1C7LK32_GRIFR|nr:hypothetical protein A0H81_14907 [Grifola frondosa]
MTDRTWLLYLADAIKAIEDLSYFAYSPKLGPLPLPTNLAQVYKVQWVKQTTYAPQAVYYELVTDTVPTTDLHHRKYLWISYVKDAGPARVRATLAYAIASLAEGTFTVSLDARQYS